MKKILYLTFYFEPDLCAGSFRNTPLAKMLAQKSENKFEIDLITTLPNRYSSFSIDAPEIEKRGNLNIYRIPIPEHKSGMQDQILSFKTYYSKVKRIASSNKYDLVIASSSRLFTAYLGFTIAKAQKIPLYLDIRDIFYDTLEDVLPSRIHKALILPLVKFIERRTFSYSSHINLISEGFKEYFRKYSKPNYSYYPNGIDDIFIDNYLEKVGDENDCSIRLPKTIVYAGNIGEGQGLHKIVPKIAQLLGSDYKFLIIGDGGSKHKLLEETKSLNLNNVEFLPPIKRDELIEIYNKADYLFVHLNDFKAFEKVLPSKLFELATFPKPIIAGVGGFAAKFVEDNIENSILFKPCDYDDFMKKFKLYKYRVLSRDKFINEYKRESVNNKLTDSMMKYL